MAGTARFCVSCRKQLTSCELLAGHARHRRGGLHQPPGTDDERDEHRVRPNFWAGNRWLPRSAQHRNVLVCIHHVLPDEPRPFSHAYFPHRAFDEVLQRGGWTFGRKGAGYVALYSQHPARWSPLAEYAEVELRSEAPSSASCRSAGPARCWPPGRRSSSTATRASTTPTARRSSARAATRSP